jgi:hypothetical protein
MNVVRLRDCDIVQEVKVFIQEGRNPTSTPDLESPPSVAVDGAQRRRHPSQDRHELTRLRPRKIRPLPTGDERALGRGTQRGSGGPPLV